MNRQEKEKLVLELYKQGKIIRETAQKVHMSFGDICFIIGRETDFTCLYMHGFNMSSCILHAVKCQAASSPKNVPMNPIAGYTRLFKHTPYHLTLVDNNYDKK
jgi:hypothetical protein